jgi:LIM domain kinase 1
MSPEILMGVDFSLPSDVFSLGVIFCEILSRHLVDGNTFKREMPGFGLDAAEVREMASKGCPERFIQLSLDCVDEDPSARPDMREVIRRLREIEQEVLAREAQAGTLRCVGSLRGSSLQAVVGTKASSRRAGGRPMPPRLPSFSGQVQVGSSAPIREETAHSRDSSGSESDEDMSEALAALEKVGLNPASLDGPESALGTITSASTFKVSGHGNPWWSDESSASLPSLRSSWVRRATPADEGAKAESTSDEDKAGDSQYSTSVVRPSKTKEMHAPLPMTMSAHTIGREGAADVSESSITVRGHEAAPTEVQPLLEAAQAEADNSGDDEVTQSFMTARSRRQEASLAMATICSSIHSGHGPLYHRFTLIKNGMKRPASLGSAAAAAASGNITASQVGGSLLPPGVILANALSKCHVCGRRLGFGAFMDCDDCPYK